jgi:hypothetical protein
MKPSSESLYYSGISSTVHQLAQRGGLAEKSILAAGSG